jgi:hypothetical protein
VLKKNEKGLLAEGQRSLFFGRNLPQRAEAGLSSTILLRKARFYPTYPILAENHVSSKNNKMLRTVRLPKTPAKTDKVPRAHIILENQIEGFVYFK